MKRIIGLVLTIALALSSVGCQRKVQVRTGVRVRCTYGELISTSISVKTVPARDAANYRVADVTRTCDKHLRLEAAYAEAQRALAKGDIKTAKKALTEVVSVDPTYRKAKAQLDKIAKGKKPKPDNTPFEPGSSGSANPGAGSSPPELTKWIPGSLAGWEGGKSSEDPLSASREYFPRDSSSAGRAVIYVEQFRSGSEAKTALDRQVRSPYSKDQKDLTVDGHKAYFGTDGREFAVIAFTSGPVLVAVEMTSLSGPPKELRDSLEAFVKLLP